MKGRQSFNLSFLYAGFLLNVNKLVVRFQPFASRLNEVLLGVLRVHVLPLLLVGGPGVRRVGEVLIREYVLQLLLKVQAHRLTRYRHL